MLNQLKTLRKADQISEAAVKSETKVEYLGSKSLKSLKK